MKTLMRAEPNFLNIRHNFSRLRLFVEIHGAGGGI